MSLLERILAAAAGVIILAASIGVIIGSYLPLYPDEDEKEDA